MNFGKTANQACCACGGGSDLETPDGLDDPPAVPSGNCYDSPIDWNDAVGGEFPLEDSMLLFCSIKYHLTIFHTLFFQMAVCGMHRVRIVNSMEISFQTSLAPQHLMHAVFVEEAQQRLHKMIHLGHLRHLSAATIQATGETVMIWIVNFMKRMMITVIFMVMIMLVLMEKQLMRPVAFVVVV